MACHSPRTIQRRDNGSVGFHDSPGDVGAVVIPCRKCLGCRLDYGQEWSIRCQHEAQLYKRNSFVTLTYSDKKLPENGSLQYRDVQLFLKKLRRRRSERLRFFCAGEYGTSTHRPHYHLLLFNTHFARDRQIGKQLYESDELSELWEAGHSSHGEVTPASATYVARYSLKKVFGREAAEKFYQGRVPEFCHMSNRPGLGAAWLEAYCSDVFPRDYVVVSGRKYRVPNYYNRRLEEMKVEYGDLLEDRERRFIESDAANRAPERLEAAREILEAQHALKKGRVL